MENRNIQSNEVMCEVALLKLSIRNLYYQMEDSENFNAPDSGFREAMKSLEWAERHLEDINIKVF